MSVSKRVAEEQGCVLGTIVGYSIRFDRKMDDDTKICFFTDGKLIQEMKNDPLLLRYQYIIIDEAHERSLSSDLLLILTK